MKYLKVFTDFVIDMEFLGDAERGRLFTAMLNYTATGEEPTFKGNERFVWGTAKKNIDNQLSEYKAMCERNRKNVTTRYESLREATKSYDSCQDKEKDKEKEYIKEIPSKEGTKKSSRFSPPTVDEVREYCKERGNGVDPVRFVDFYSSKGWRVGNNPMKDWKAAVRTWEAREPKVSVPEKPQKEHFSKSALEAFYKGR